MKTILIKNAVIATLGARNRLLRGHAILIEGGLIKKIAPAKSFRGKYTKVIDGSGKLAMPGFINAHMHFYSTLPGGSARSNRPGTSPRCLKTSGGAWTKS